MGMTPEYIANLKKAVDNLKNKGEMAKIASKAGTFYDFDINIIIPDPNQPRKKFDEAALQELADDIKKNGLIQPIVVRDDLEHPGKFIVVAGERRLKAAKIAGLTKIRSIVGTYDDSQLGYVQIAENAKRDDLKFYELAQFIVSRAVLGEKQAEIAEKLGLSKTKVSEFMIWKDAPEFLKSAKEKFSSIRTFYDVAKLADEFSSDVEDFIENSDSEISRAEIAALKKKLTSPEETPDAEDNSEESTDATYISSDYEIANDEEQPSEGSDISMSHHLNQLLMMVLVMKSFHLKILKRIQRHHLMIVQKMKTQKIVPMIIRMRLSQVLILLLMMNQRIYLMQTLNQMIQRKRVKN